MRALKEFQEENSRYIELLDIRDILIEERQVIMDFIETKIDHNFLLNTSRTSNFKEILMPKETVDVLLRNLCLRRNLIW